MKKIVISALLVSFGFKVLIFLGSGSTLDFVGKVLPWVWVVIILFGFSAPFFFGKKKKV